MSTNNFLKSVASGFTSTKAAIGDTDKDRERGKKLRKKVRDFVGLDEEPQQFRKGGKVKSSRDYGK